MNLNNKVTDLPKVGPFLSGKLKKLGIHTIADLFNHVPSRYEDYSKILNISQIKAGETVTIHAKVNSIANVLSKRGVRMQIGSVEDKTGKITVVWFNQPFLTKMLYPGRTISLSGRVGFFNRNICLNSPDYEILESDDSETVHTGRLVPIYPETQGISSKWLRTIILKAFTNPDLKLTDLLPGDIITKYKLMDLPNAIKSVHFPDKLSEAEKGRERLAFDELIRLQLLNLLRKSNWKNNKVTNVVNTELPAIATIEKELTFTLTDSQKKSINEILKDMNKDIPMNRLLEGDVGSGKTVVAAYAMFAVFINGYQSILMAPTQILAKQHYETLKKLFKPFSMRISLLTSDTKKVELGSSDIFIGTHSLIHSKINFNKVALVVIDEQHRFGVEQRLHLVKKTGTPHVLTMTATPIPRTVALTAYGDLDLSVLDEMPKNRQKVITWAVPEQKRHNANEWIKNEITKNKSQVFIVCPLIDDSTTETMKDIKSVNTEYEKLKTIYSGFRLGLLHGRLGASEKESVLKKFRDGKMDILVTTPVVEVGIDIPNATVMVIESAERFGLAQLHQLRGRVGRGDKKSYCLLFSAFHSGRAFERLKAMEKIHSGFKLAELDLKMRGPGEIFGTLQSGFPELKIASWTNLELIKKSKEAAFIIYKNSNKYSSFIKEFNLSAF